MFHQSINRHDTNSLKFDKYPSEVIPAWVADMDFKAPEPIIKALQKRVEHGVFGYTNVSEELKENIISFLSRHHGWRIKKEWLIFVSGVVPSMNICCKMLAPNQSVMSTKPIYPHFFKAPKMNERDFCLVELKEINNRFTLDFEAIKEALTSTCKLFMLCNPCNPSGTVFTKDELLALGEICKQNDIFICSDEIHSDLVLDLHVKHIPIASLSEDLANRTITLMAPSKTFNIAGLNCSFAIIPNKELRHKFAEAMAGLNGGVNLFGLVGANSAYSGECDEWLENLKEYMRENLLLVEEFVKKNPKLKMKKHEATYLAWIDCRDLGVDAYKLFLDSGVGLSDGVEFLGEGFVRLNFGTPKANLKTILSRMQNALDGLDNT